MAVVHAWDTDGPVSTMEALRAALAQPEQEPVAYLWQHGETNRTRIIERDQVWTANDRWNCVGPLYLPPPQRQPLIGCVGHDCAECQARAATPPRAALTVDQIIEATRHIDSNAPGLFVVIARAIEAAHNIGGPRNE